MRWVLAIAMTSISVFPWSSAAADSGDPVRLGILMGLNHSSRNGDLADMQWVNGFAGGLSLRVNQPRRPWVEFQMLYSRKGSAWTEGGLDSDLRLTYLEFPILFGLPLRITDSLFFEPRAGFAPARKVDEELTIDGSSFSSHYFNDWDVGVIFGASVRRELARVGLSFEIRYTIGLIDIDNPDETDFRGSDRNRSVSFLAGAAF